MINAKIDRKFSLKERFKRCAKIMKQILQNLSNGETSLVDVPCPKNKSGHLLIASQQTLVSAGTERMLVDLNA